MEYTVGQLARLAGISSRTLRYYDEIGLLKPARTDMSGQRIYGLAEVDRLQRILFFKAFEVKLDDVKDIMNRPDYDSLDTLRNHLAGLLERRKRLDLLITNVKKTIAAVEGEIEMSDKEKFEGLKRALAEENEAKYGGEIRQKYGEQTVIESNDRFLQLRSDEWDDAQRLADDLIQTLLEAVKSGEPSGELAQKAADMHRRWLGHYWGNYSREAHAGIAQMYVDDPRFTHYYDRHQPGLAKFLRDAIYVYTGMGMR